MIRLAYEEYFHTAKAASLSFEYLGEIEYPLSSVESRAGSTVPFVFPLDTRHFSPCFSAFYCAAIRNLTLFEILQF